MPWNGSGVFSRLYNWTADAAGSIDITASRMDADTNDITAGLMHCLTANGETVPVANLPMANFRHTGASNGLALNDYATIGQIINGGGGLPAGGYLPLAGGTVTGALTVNGATTLNSTLSVGGTGINYSGYYSGHHIAWGWDGSHLIGYVDNISEGPVVFANYSGNLSVSGTVSAGGVVTSGTAQGGYLNSTGNINASGAITASGNVSGASLTVPGAGSWSNSGGWMYCSVGIQTPTQININGLTWSNNSGWMYTGSAV